MAEKTVEKELCQNCGAEVRPDTTFCYNCGYSVESENQDGGGTGFPRVTNKLSEKDLPARDEEVNLSAKIESDKEVGISNKKRRRKASVLKEIQPKSVSSSKETQLKSAASLRKEERSIQKKTVEVVWEEPESAPNVWFLVVAFLLTLFAAGIFVAMLYVR